MQVGQDAPLARQKLVFDQEARGTVHLNHVLNVVLLIKALLSNLHLLVTFEESLAPGPPVTAALDEAAAEGLEARYQGVGAVVGSEFLAFLDFVPHMLPWSTICIRAFFETG